MCGLGGSQVQVLRCFERKIFYSILVLSLFKDKGETLLSAHCQSDLSLKYSTFSDKTEVLLRGVGH